MRTRDIMTAGPTCVKRADTLVAAQGLMETGGFHHLPVLEDGRLVGVIAGRDLRMHAERLGSLRVDDVMTTGPMTAAPDTPIAEVADRLLRHNVGGLPVLDEGRLVGIVTRTDVLKAVAQGAPLLQAGEAQRHRTAPSKRKGRPGKCEVI